VFILAPLAIRITLTEMVVWYIKVHCIPSLLAQYCTWGYRLLCQGDTKYPSAYLNWAKSMVVWDWRALGHSQTFDWLPVKARRNTYGSYQSLSWGRYFTGAIKNHPRAVSHRARSTTPLKFFYGRFRALAFTGLNEVIHYAKHCQRLSATIAWLTGWSCSE
jgi:hypothetical protein